MGLKVTIVGATGAVGAEFLKVLAASTLPIDSLRLLATARSAGRKLTFQGREIAVEATSPETLRGADVVFVSATTEASKTICPLVAEDGGVAIDDSSAFRLEARVPLVVPEVNSQDLLGHRGIVSTPNCTTVPLVMALHPLRKAAEPKRVVVDTYQAVSGAGGAAMVELTEETSQALAGKPTAPKVFPHQIAFNALPQVDSFMDTGYTKEEWKMCEETKKILHTPDLAFSATCVRVPVYRGHSMAAHVEFDRPVEPQAARQLLSSMPGMRVVDEPAKGQYPMPLNAANTNPVFVGRIRKDNSHPTGLAMWLTADNLLKGAALNAVQIAEDMYRRKLIKQR
jgi:aspartate-semialdehyde dehydrogenase